MLSRTADNLFWMCRYIERAENTARMLDVNLQMSLMPQDASAHDSLWRAVLRISELQHDYDARFPAVTALDVLHYLVREPTNESSIYACLRAARENARAVRGSLTTEVWETYNTTWLELQKHLQTHLPERNPGEFFEWVKFRAHLARGVTIGTMLDDEALHFLRLGMHVERADNTARLLDVKFHEEHEEHEDIVARTSEFYRWASLLSSVSGLEIYRKVYRDVITSDRVAELLILRPDMPRSLVASVQALTEDLARVANQRSAETERRAGMLYAELRYGRVEDILHSGLHRYLERFLERINDLGNRISQDFLVPLVA
ncbi:alpha-E domain-containing protein [Bordetella tumulicola]|uniref:alpha-E domain-containing protein n=1 Tax=Bordetella tumulicola TaxID=1649133 RepID=UPI0039F0CBD4